MVTFLFFTSLFILLYIHLFYPLILIILGFIKNINLKNEGVQPRPKLNFIPSISVVIAAYNEESIIERKIMNCLELDYPSEQLEIIIFSDGSTDQTDAIVERYAYKGLKLLRFEGRIGKTACQNRAVKDAKGSIIVYSDATSLLSDDCLKSIVSKFSDQEVGCVVGKLESTTKTGENGSGIEESFYLSFLQWLKKLENDASMPVGGSGALFAVRKELTVELPADANDDLLRPLFTVARGFTIVYDQEAVATEILSINDHAVFRKKIRIAQRAAMSLILYRQLLNPLKYGVFSLQFFTKVILRRLIFPVLVVYLVSGLFLYIDSRSKLILLLTLPVAATICLAVYGGVISMRKNALEGGQKLSRFCYYYYLSTIGAFIGLVKGFCGFRITKWN